MKLALTHTKPLIMKKLVFILIASGFIIACGKPKEKANNENLEKIEQVEKEMEESK